MHSPDKKAPALAIWSLGLTQIVGYGTLFYSFSVLAPSMALEFSLPQQWVFAALSAALFLGSLFAPIAGRWADRFGAGRLMTGGSLAASLALAACALAPGRISFVAALIAMELASCFVLYATAFAAIVQIGRVGAQRSITHLTLIAGFASTLFWPLTSLLHEHLTWREVYLLFAAMNLLVCLPIHAWLMRLSRWHGNSAAANVSAPVDHPLLDAPAIKIVFLLMLAGFAIEGFVLSAILLHMVPLLSVLGLGTAGVMVSTLFGPSQVASRLVNMIFGGRLPQTMLAIIGASLLAAGLLMLVLAAPSVPGIAISIVLFGLGSGLASIVGGTLPLELFGRAGYGARLGWVSGARQFSSSFAPFIFAFMMAQWSVGISLWWLIFIGAAGVVIFAAIALIQRRSLRKALPQDVALLPADQTG
jgi:MFS family permease